MSIAESATFSLPTASGGATFVRRWEPSAQPRALIVIAHGVSEHSERYDRVSRQLAAAGLRVYASDHRGHGRTVAAGQVGNAGPDGWAGILTDLHAVLERARADAPRVPVFFLGHSMGAIIAQQFIAQHGELLAGAILSGVPGSFTGRDDIIAAARAAADGDEPDAPSQLFGSMFASFNAPYESVTGFEWLSRDPAEVRKYADDPLSGNPLTNATLADFLPGWAAAGSAQTQARVPKTLPLLIISGDRDPAGDNGAAPSALAAAYRQHGLSAVTLTLYPQARHELFNETNRDDVVRDLIDWINAHVTDRRTSITRPGDQTIDA